MRLPIKKWLEVHNVTLRENIAHEVSTVMEATTKWQEMTGPDRAWLLMNLRHEKIQAMSLEELKSLAEQGDLAFLPNWLHVELTRRFNLERKTWVIS